MLLHDRYLIAEFLAAFFLVLGGFAVLMTGNSAFTMADAFSQHGIPVWTILQFLALRLPAMLVLGAPVAVLFAIFLSLGRLSRDSELLALQTSGVAFQRIALPIVAMSACLGTAVFACNELIVPTANRESQRIMLGLLRAEILEPAQAAMFFKLPGDRVIYSDGVGEDSTALQGIWMFETGTTSGIPDVILADSGTLDSRTLRLQRGTQFTFTADGEIEHIGAFKESRNDITRQMGELLGVGMSVQERSASRVKDDIDEREDAGLSVGALKTDYYFKFSIPAACLIFALVGLVFVMRMPRRENHAGLLAGLGLVMGYWICMTFSRGMGQHGMLDPLLAAWLPNMLFGTLGCGVLLRSRE